VVRRAATCSKQAASLGLLGVHGISSRRRSGLAIKRATKSLANTSSDST
jgi:hypothetical protein